MRCKYKTSLQSFSSVPIQYSYCPKHCLFILQISHQAFTFHDPKGNQYHLTSLSGMTKLKFKVKVAIVTRWYSQSILSIKIKICRVHLESTFETLLEFLALQFLLFKILLFLPPSHHTYLPLFGFMNIY